MHLVDIPFTDDASTTIYTSDSFTKEFIARSDRKLCDLNEEV